MDLIYLFEAPSALLLDGRLGLAGPLFCHGAVIADICPIAVSIAVAIPSILVLGSSSVVAAAGRMVVAVGSVVGLIALGRLIMCLRAGRLPVDELMCCAVMQYRI